MAVALFALTAAMAVDSRNQRKKAERKQDRLESVEKAQVDERAARERRNQIRQARIASASIQNQAASSGLSTSSAAIAGVAGVQQQANVAIGDINQTVGFNNLTAQLEQDIFDLQQPTTFQQVGQVAQAGLSMYSTAADKRAEALKASKTTT